MIDCQNNKICYFNRQNSFRAKAAQDFHEKTIEFLLNDNDLKQDNALNN